MEQTLERRCKVALECLPDARYRTMLAELLDDLLAHAAVPVVQPQKPVAYVWYGHVGPGARSLRWRMPSQWDYTTRVDPLYLAPAPERARYSDSPAGEPAVRALMAQAFEEGADAMERAAIDVVRRRHAQRDEVCAAWHALPDDLRQDQRLTRLYHALGGPHMEEPTDAALQRTALGWQQRAEIAERNWRRCHRWAVASGVPLDKLGDDPGTPWHEVRDAEDGNG